MKAVRVEFRTLGPRSTTSMQSWRSRMLLLDNYTIVPILRSMIHFGMSLLRRHHQHMLMQFPNRGSKTGHQDHPV